MSDPLIDELRPLGLEKHAARLTRVVGDAMQIVVGTGQIQKGLILDAGGEMAFEELDHAADRLSSDGDFVLDVLRKIGNDRFDSLVQRANVPDQAALQIFRDRVRKDGGILPMMEPALGGVHDRLSTTRAGLKAELARLPDASVLSAGAAAATAPKLPSGPMMTMSNHMGCTGAKLMIGGGAGLMVAGMLLEDPGMFTFGAAALGIGIGAASYFC